MARILLIISGSIAAYKCLDAIRELKRLGIEVSTILTRGGQEFVTPLSVASLSGGQVYTELFSLKDEVEMGHIRLSREADLIVIAPASADILARMVTGQTDDLATTTLLASDKPILAAPAMNVRMWQHPATQRNVAQLKADGVHFIGPASGDLACGEQGDGRMVEPLALVEAIEQFFRQQHPRPLLGKHAIVTAGPTYEPIDPVRFLGNYSSGKQGYAIASALQRAGAKVTLISGPTSLATPQDVTIERVNTAQEMLAACEGSLPADIAVFTAAVADWRPQETAPGKLKKQGTQPPTLTLTENPDILATISHLPPTTRPGLIIGFAAETDAVDANARAKRLAKGCDWLLANDVSGGKVFGGETTQLTFISEAGEASWPAGSKQQAAEQLTAQIIKHFSTHSPNQQKVA